MLRLHIFFIYLVLLNSLQCFQDDAIFEEEDIYNQALPPAETTGTTLPGTKWCGPGNTAKNYNDLGSQKETDKCCRAHDHCPEIIEQNRILHGLNNPDVFPRMKCTCEQEFINCLQNVNDTVSTYLGRIYFGFRSKCFGEAYPILNCKQQMGAGKLAEKRCVRYNLDKTKSKTWQFFDNPFFTNKLISV